MEKVISIFQGGDFLKRRGFEMKKLLWIGVLVMFAFVTVLSAPAWAAYPEKPVTVICPWGAGGGTDRLARFLADELSKKFGQPFTVVNKTGGAGAVGHAAGAYAPPDGYTITIVTLELATMHWMGLTDLTYEAFDYVAQVNEDPAGVTVRADAPWKNLDKKTLLKFIAVLSAGFVFEPVLNFLGSILGLTVISIFLMKLFRVKWLQSIIYSLALSIFIYWIFRGVFKLPLPDGKLILLLRG